MTYPQEAVANLINQRFVPVQANVKENSAKPLIERYRQVWTPDIRILGSDGFEYDRWNGYLPPYELMPQLLVAQGQAYLRIRDFIDAASVYDEVLRLFPTSYCAPEAQYFLAVCRYEESHQGTDLLSGYHRLQTRYPDSIWRVKQSYTELK